MGGKKPRTEGARPQKALWPRSGVWVLSLSCFPEMSGVWGEFYMGKVLTLTLREMGATGGFCSEGDRV